ncbi:MAG TPA: endonuclease [Gammaproteobacteria bacterium]|nr:endonuclease [Gammaproteobacteria bacterium]
MITAMITATITNKPLSTTYTVMAVYDALLQQHGPQHWWPADTSFEMAVGAILTQATRWHNAELALATLREKELLQPQDLADMDLATLQQFIRPAGFYTQKARRIQYFSRWLLDQDGFAGLTKLPMMDIRKRLLDLPGIGPETADCILLYACKRPIFVIDTYTRRLAVQLGWCNPAISYARLQQLFENALPPDANLYNEYHALIVKHNKQSGGNIFIFSDR